MTVTFGTALVQIVVRIFVICAANTNISLTFDVPEGEHCTSKLLSFSEHYFCSALIKKNLSLPMPAQYTFES
jgi:hypothetical protein